jgi:hypothetical protein
VTRAFVAAVALVALAACGGKDTGRADSAARLNVAQVPAAAQRAPGPGELTKPLADYTGEEFYQLTQTLQYAGANERTRRCRGAGCEAGNPPATTRLRVEGIVREDSVGLVNVPPFGVIVARGRNLGGRPDAMYGMRPGAPYSYFLVILPPTAPGGAARWQIEQLDAQGVNRAHSPLTTGFARGCNHPFRPGARSDFRTCADTSTVRPASLRFQGGNLEAPWWFNCDDGCCTTDGPSQG